MTYDRAPSLVWIRWFIYWVVLLLALVALGAGLWWYTKPPGVPYSKSPLVQQAYVWQRNWNDPVKDAVTTNGKSFERLIVLAAEISWKTDPPDVSNVRPNYAALRSTGVKVGLAIRIDSLPKDHEGAFEPTSPQSKLVLETVKESLQTAKEKGLAPRELQIDFDSAERDLAGYAKWVAMIRDDIKPVPIVITALPSWLDAPAFKEVATAAGEFVLQVHSVEPPEGPDAPMKLCDPAKARRWTEQASRVGVPYRVALPTYGYIAAFSDEGKLLGLSAEKSRAWPEGTTLRRLMADPAEIAPLVADWTKSHPVGMNAIIWYRLPVDAQDSLNWRQITLDRVMTGATPTPKVEAATAKGADGATEIYLTNTGQADAEVTGDVIVETEVSAADAIAGAQKIDTTTGVAFRVQPNSIADRLRPRERRQVGWIRTKTPDKEVRAHVVPTTAPATTAPTSS